MVCYTITLIYPLGYKYPGLSLVCRSLIHFSYGVCAVGIWLAGFPTSFIINTHSRYYINYLWYVNPLHCPITPSFLLLSTCPTPTAFSSPPSLLVTDMHQPFAAHYVNSSGPGVPAVDVTLGSF